MEQRVPRPSLTDPGSINLCSGYYHKPISARLRVSLKRCLHNTSVDISIALYVRGWDEYNLQATTKKT